MNIDKFRFENKSTIVDHAFRIFEVKDNSIDSKRQWIDYLLAGGDPQEMLDALRNNKASPISKTQSGTAIEAQGAIKYCIDNPVLPARSMHALEVIVENRSRTTWHTTEKTPLNLCYHWYFDNGKVCIYDGCRTPLPEPIAPGQALKVAANVQTPSKAGNYLLEVTMLLEGEFWLEDRGLSITREAVRVIPPAEAVNLLPISEHANNIYHKLISALTEQNAETVLCAS